MLALAVQGDYLIDIDESTLVVEQAVVAFTSQIVCLSILARVLQYGTQRDHCV